MTFLSHTMKPSMILCHFGLWVNHRYVLHFHCATLLLPPLHSSIFPSTSIAHFHCNYSSFAKFNYIFCMHMFFNLVANFNNVFCINIINTLHPHRAFPIWSVSNSVCFDFVCICIVPILYSAPMQCHNQNKFRCRLWLF